MSGKQETGNHALCGAIARLLETAKLDGFLNGVERAKLTGLMSELSFRYDRALTAIPPPAPDAAPAPALAAPLDGSIPATSADKEDD